MIFYEEIIMKYWILLFLFTTFLSAERLGWIKAQGDSIVDNNGKIVDIKFSGHCIECRVNAEDPERFIPSPGTVSLFIPPGGKGVRTDTAAFSGWKVPAHYDSLIAKLIVHGKDRGEAIMRMKRALREFIVDGIKTTIPFYINLLDDPDFIKGNFNTTFLDNFKFKK